MTKKYELIPYQGSGGRYSFSGFQIIAADGCKVPGINPGDKGGLVSDENILSHDGNSWIHNRAVVGKGCIVKDDAQIKGWSKIKGNVILCDESLIEDFVDIQGNLIISGRSHIFQHAKLDIDGTITDDVSIYGGVSISGQIDIRGDSRIHGNHRIHAFAELSNVRLSSTGDIVGVVHPKTQEHIYVVRRFDGYYMLYHGSYKLTDISDVMHSPMHIQTMSSNILDAYLLIMGHLSRSGHVACDHPTMVM